MSPTDRIARLAALNPAAADLALACSLALRVEPALLRTLRLMLPDADAGAEADLWLSDLLSGRDASAVALDPLVAGELRQRLRDPTLSWLRDRAAERIVSAHRTAHWSVRLEERIRWLDCTADRDALSSQADELLLAALQRLRSEADPGAIARWLLGAWGRLPVEVSSSQLARVSQAAAGLTVDGRAPEPGLLSPAESAGWLPWLISTMPTVEVPVAMREGAVVIGGSPAGEPGPDPGDETLLPGVPDTDPLVLEVFWVGGSRPGSQRVRFRLGEPVQVETGTRSVTLVTLAGTAHDLSLDEEGTARSAGGLRFEALKARLRPCLAREQELKRLLDLDGLYDGRRAWVGISGPPGSGASTMLVAATDALADRGFAVVEHYFGPPPRGFAAGGWYRPGSADDPQVVTLSCLSHLAESYPQEWAEASMPTEPGGSERPSLEPALRSLERSGAFRRRPLVIALDGLPVGSDGRSVLWELPFPSQPPAGVRYLVTCREWSAVRGYLEDGDARAVVGGDAASDERVCRAMLERVADRVVQACAAPLTPPGIDALVDLAGRNPGTLDRIVRWVVRQPAGSVRLEAVPPVLTARWPELRSILESRAPGFSEVLLDLLRAADGRHTMADLDAAVATIPGLPPQSWADFLSGAAGLLAPSGADDVVHLAAPEAVDRLTADVPYGDRYLGLGHDSPATVARRGSATRLAAATAHALAAGDQMDAAALSTDPLVLRRRYVEDPAGLLADLAQVAGRLAEPGAVLAVHAALRSLIKHRVPVERFLAALRDRMASNGAPGLAAALDQDGLPAPLRVRRALADDELRADAAPVRMAGPVLALVRPAPSAELAALTATGLLSFPDVVPQQTFPEPVLGAVRDRADEQRYAYWTRRSVVIVDDTSTNSVPLTWPAEEIERVVRFAASVALCRHDTVLMLSALEPPAQLVGHAARVTEVADAGDGSRLTAAMDGTIRRWRTGRNAPLQTYVGHRGGVTCLEVMAQGRFVTGGEDGCVLFWTVDGEGRPVERWQAHQSSISALRVAGNVVLAGATDGSVAVRSGGVSRPLGRQHEPVRGVAIAGSLLVSWADEVRFWPLQGAGAIGIRAFPGGARDVVVDTHGYTVLCGDGSVERHPLPGTAAGDEDRPELGALVLNQGSALLGQRTQLLELNESGRLSPLPVGLEGPAVQAAVASGGILVRTPGRTTFLAADPITVQSEGPARLESPNPPAGATHTVVAGDTVAGIAARYGSTVQELVQLNALGSTTLVRPGQILRLPGSAEPGFAGGRWAATPISGPATLIAAHPAAGFARAQDRSVQYSAGVPAELQERFLMPAAVSCLAVDAFGSVAGGSVDGTVGWARWTGMPYTLAGSGAPVTSVTMTGESTVVFGTSTGEVTWWPVGDIPETPYRAGSSITGLVPVGGWLVSASRDGALLLWDAARRRVVHQVDLGAPAVALAGEIGAPDRPSTVAARDAGGRLWLLDLEETTVPPGDDPLAAVALHTAQLRLLLIETSTGSLVTGPGAEFDVIALRARIGGEPQPLTGRFLGLRIGSDGTLAVPWRLTDEVPVEFDLVPMLRIGSTTTDDLDLEVTLMSPRLPGYRATIHRTPAPNLGQQLA